jgi:UDP-N-acetylglucosamine:LPS N-acetylglucosamine transferase
LLGGEGLPQLKKNLKDRLARLDPDRSFRSQVVEDIKPVLGEFVESPERQAPLLTFAVGGAGAQSELIRDFLPGARRLIVSGGLRLALVAGIRGDIAERFRTWLRADGLLDQLGSSIQILHEPQMTGYFPAFNRLLAETDILWTKPSEMTFFGALGLALLLAPPVGVHERYNRRWAIERGAAIKQRDARYTADHLEEWIHDGTLAAAAWSGFMLLPKHGTYLIPKEISTPR